MYNYSNTTKKLKYNTFRANRNRTAMNWMKLSEIGPCGRFGFRHPSRSFPKRSGQALQRRKLDSFFEPESRTQNSLSLLKKKKLQLSVSAECERRGTKRKKHHLRNAFSFCGEERTEMEPERIIILLQFSRFHTLEFNEFLSDDLTIYCDFQCVSATG